MSLGKAFKYTIIKDKIIHMIQDGFYNEGDKLPSEQELAAVHQVSNITSKKALDELESEGFIKRIKGSGSYVTKNKQETVSGKLNMIAMVLPFGGNTGGAMDLFAGVESVAKANGFYVGVENTYANCQREREIIVNLMKDDIKGIIYYPTYTSENFDLLKKLSMENYPIVIIDKAIHEIDLDTVLCDNYRASFNMTTHLIECGHRRIAFVCEGRIDDISSIRERFLGYCDALQNAKISLDLGLIHSQNDASAAFSVATKSAFLKQVVESVCEEGAATAIQAATDVDAVEMLRYIRKRGIAVPEELSIVGFDDLDIASYISPPLTTIRQDFVQIGRKAAELAINRIADRKKKPEQVLVPAELIIRKSSCPL